MKLSFDEKMFFNDTKSRMRVSLRPGAIDGIQSDKPTARVDPAWFQATSVYSYLSPVLRLVRAS
jgi:hypothetical protein